MNSFPELLFLGHLDELRSRLIKFFAVLVVAFCIAWVFSRELVSAFITPAGHLIFTSPEDAFAVRLSMTIWGGFVLAMPYLVFQVWQFVSPGLAKHEQKYFKVFGILSIAMLFLGAAFGYFVLVPMSFKFLLGFSSPGLTPMITADRYFSFAFALLGGCSLIFELPLLIILLTMFGLVSPVLLKQARKYVIVAVLIISAIVTPPDAASQLFLAIPVLLVYELSIFISQIIINQGHKKKEEGLARS